MSGELAGKVAFVTGSGRGLGRVMAERLAENGADVAMHDIDWTAPAKYGEFADVGVVNDVLVSIGHHGAPPIPAPTPHDVDGGCGKRVGRADYRADVGVVREVLDGDMHRVTARVDVLDYRFPRPVPVLVQDVSTITLGQQYRVVALVGRRFRVVFLGPRSDTVGILAPLGGSRFTGPAGDVVGCDFGHQNTSLESAATVKPCVV